MEVRHPGRLKRFGDVALLVALPVTLLALAVWVYERFFATFEDYVEYIAVVSTDYSYENGSKPAFYSFAEKRIDNLTLEWDDVQTCEDENGILEVVSTNFSSRQRPLLSSGDKLPLLRRLMIDLSTEESHELLRDVAVRNNFESWNYEGDTPSYQVTTCELLHSASLYTPWFGFKKSIALTSSEYLYVNDF